MPALPDGDPAPADGRLPDGLDWSRPMRAYVHVPFCTVRCGYCDFNTYTASELGGFSTQAFLQALQREIELAARVTHPKALASVFIGGGTPSLLSGDQINEILAGLREGFGLEPSAEVTMEANPENVTPAALEGWLNAGVNRLSLGMQSADPDALRILQRQHTPGAAVEAARSATFAGFEHVSLDLIYGIPGQSLRSWQETVDTAIGAGTDHISAYALGVESGTALARQVARGEVPNTDPDQAAAQYDAADDVLSAAGYQWYEISNWAKPGGQCEHNLGYWHNDNWWGFGPGAHSHVDGVRWWNVKRPVTYQSMLVTGTSPAAGRETVDPEGRRLESIMLQVRLAEGIDAGPGTQQLVKDGLLEKADGARLRLTRKGRMLADAVVRVLTD
jgi:putative oxygen-independent coproporphyrinogen III oxidase